MSSQIFYVNSFEAIENKTTDIHDHMCTHIVQNAEVIMCSQKSSVKWSKSLSTLEGIILTLCIKTVTKKTEVHFGYVSHKLVFHLVMRILFVCITSFNPCFSPDLLHGDLNTQYVFTCFRDFFFAAWKTSDFCARSRCI